jgi:hypothetical protein
MAGRVLLITLLAMGAVDISGYLTGTPVSIIGGFSVVLHNILYQLFLIAAAVFNIRHIIFRLRDRDQ